jgi:hypothetical protein
VVYYKHRARGKEMYCLRYWLVCCYVGHSGRRDKRYRREIGLAIEAPSSVDAMLIAKKFPGVKHHNSRYICTTKEITREEYIERRKVSAYEKALW